MNAVIMEPKMSKKSVATTHSITNFVLPFNGTVTNFLACFLVACKHQATRRHSVAWQDSLRYRRPDLDRMPGLRRITICKNPLINDHGAELIAEALKDDLWVKGYFTLNDKFPGT